MDAEDFLKGCLGRILIRGIIAVCVVGGLVVANMLGCID